ncbi:MAG: hypothetical protein WCD77_16250 [Acidobacteriaceae bacterium]
MSSDGDFLGMERPIGSAEHLRFAAIECDFDLRSGYVHDARGHTPTQEQAA